MSEQQEPENTQEQDQTSSIYQPPPPTVAQFLSSVDPNAVPEVRPLTGYLINAGANRLRLYFTLEMNNAVEFSIGAVLALQPLNTRDNTLPSAIVLLKRDAPLWRITRIQAQDEVDGGCNVPPLVCTLSAVPCQNGQCPSGFECQSGFCHHKQT
jgi:hypothetical protein